VPTTDPPNASAEPAEDQYQPAPFDRVFKLRELLDAFEEAEMAPALGLTPRGMQHLRLTGGDIPPHIRVGRKILYPGLGARKWLQDKINAADGIKPRANRRVPA
jgi:hypothetical protein